MGLPLLLPLGLSSCHMDISCLYMMIGFLPHGSSKVLRRMLFVFVFISILLLFFYYLHAYTHDGPEIPHNFIQTGCRLCALPGFSLDKLPFTFIYNHKRFSPHNTIFFSLRKNSPNSTCRLVRENVQTKWGEVGEAVQVLNSHRVFSFSFFVMMVKHSCDVPNPLIRHFPQSGGSGRWGWGGGQQDFLTGCNGQTAEREMCREESAERSLVSPAAFVRSVCESVRGCLEDVKSIMVRRSQRGLVISWESGKSSHL